MVVLKKEKKYTNRSQFYPPGSTFDSLESFVRFPSSKGSNKRNSPARIPRTKLSGRNGASSSHCTEAETERTLPSARVVIFCRISTERGQMGQPNQRIKKKKKNKEKYIFANCLPTLRMIKSQHRFFKEPQSLTSTNNRQSK
jgi:hypothetical protein